MNIKILFAFIGLFFAIGADAATSPLVRIFSTSTDWAGLTGLPLSRHDVKFENANKIVNKGMRLYYLDGFPCYGFGEDARVWLGGNKKQDGNIRIACVYPPREINFAWEYANIDDLQSKTTGLMKCNISGDGVVLTVDLSKCDKSVRWEDYK